MSTFTITPRTLWTERSPEGVLSPINLTDVHSHLVRLATHQKPVDLIRPLRDLNVRFENKQMLASFHDTEPMLILDSAASQMSQLVLPSRFFPGLKELAELDREGERLATEVWAKFARTHTVPRRVRTIRAKVKGEVRQLVRACVSKSYGVYSNIGFVEDIMNHAQEYANLPVLEWSITDTGMRIRFAGMDAATAAFAPWDKSVLNNATIPMVELRNSEVGTGAIGLHGGLWRLQSASGIGFWEKDRACTFYHRGDSRRLQARIEAAFETTRVIAQNLAEAYEEAKGIDIDDVHVWTSTMCASLLTAGQIEEVLKFLTDPRVTPGGSLASVVDAISMMASRRAPVQVGTALVKGAPEPDLHDQQNLEYVAALVLHKGRTIAAKTGGRLAA